MPRGVRGSAVRAGAKASRFVTSAYLNEFRFMLPPVRLGAVFLHSLPRRNARNRITGSLGHTNVPVGQCSRFSKAAQSSRIQRACRRHGLRYTTRSEVARPDWIVGFET